MRILNLVGVRPREINFSPARAKTRVDTTIFPVKSGDKERVGAITVLL